LVEEAKVKVGFEIWIYAKILEGVVVGTTLGDTLVGLQLLCLDLGFMHRV